MSFLHLRLQSSPDDFLVLKPVEPKTPDDEGSGVSNYMCNRKVSKWYFCSTCGVRTFAIRGKKVTEEVELPTTLLQKAGVVDDNAKGEMSKVKVWRCQKEGWNEWKPDRTNYLSVNATTLDVRQKGLDLRKWSEWGIIEYCNALELKADWQSVPHEGGMY
jgi:hypothetical protein